MRSFCAVLAATLLVASGPGVQAARPGPFPKTTGGIHIEIPFNSHIANLEDEEGKVDVVWGSSVADQPPGVYNSSYMPFFVDNRFGFDEQWYRDHHPDWLAYACDKKTLAYLDANHQPPLDFANPEVRQFQWQTWVDAPIEAHYPSIAIDLLHLGNYNGRCGHFNKQGKWVAQYDGSVHQTEYRRDVLAWVAATYKHVHNYTSASMPTPTATMQINVSYDETEADDDNKALMSTTDLVFDERGFTNYGNPPPHPTAELWQKIVGEIADLQTKHICYMLMGEEPQSHDQITPAERQWAVANYLLVKNNCTYMYMSGQQEYGFFFPMPEYGIAIGHPTGDRELAQGIYERSYSNGLTLVNPSDTQFRVRLPKGQWKDVNGNSVGPRVTMKAWTGLILLKQ